MKPFASSGSWKCSTSVSQKSSRSPSSRFWYAVVSKSFAAAEKTSSSMINDSLSFKASSNVGRLNEDLEIPSQGLFLYPYCLRYSLHVKWPHCKQDLDKCFYPNYNHWYQNRWVAWIQNSKLETMTCLAEHRSLFSSNLLSFLIFVTVTSIVVTASGNKRLVDWRTRDVGFIKFRMPNLAAWNTRVIKLEQEIEHLEGKELLSSLLHCRDLLSDCWGNKAANSN